MSGTGTRRGMGQSNTKRTWKQQSASVLFGMILGLLIPSLALGADATLLPNAKQQYLNDAGDPVAAGTVDYYVPSTSTRKTVWLNASKATPSTNPVVLDAAGRPQPTGQTFGDGTYRQVVKDANGLVIWDAVTNSTGGGGATPVVPTVGDGLVVGSILPWSGLAAPTNYVFAYGQAISRTAFPLYMSTVTISTNLICTSGLNVLSGIADTSQIHIGTPVEASCVAPGTTVTNVSTTSVTVSSNATISTGLAAKFFPFGNGDGSTTLNVPDLRGRVLAGRNNMGGTASSTLTSAFFGPQGPNAQGSVGGAQIHNLTANENGPHNHDVFFIDPGHTHGTTAAGGGAALFSAGGTQAFASGSFATSSVTGGFTINSALTGGSVASAASGGTGNITAFSGSGQSFSIVQPTAMINYVTKVLPDNSTVVSSGVASIGGMVGDITCGANLVCGSQTISVSPLSTTTDGVVYTAPFTGGFPQSQTAYNSKRINITDFGCVADNGVSDNGPCLRAAYDAAAVLGASIFIPPVNGWYGVSTCRNDGVFDGTSLTVANGNKSVSIIGGGWNKKPFATPQGSWLLPNSSFPSTCSWINLAGTDEVTGTVYADFGIGEFGGAYGTPKGLHGLFVNSANPAFCLDNMTVNHVFIANMAVGYSIRIAGANGCGGIANSRVQNSSLMNINATFLGDSVQFIGNTTGGNATIDSRNVGLDFFNCDGCTSTVAEHNNFLNFNGKIIARGASKPVFRDNEGEQQVGTTNTDSCLIDLKGDHAAVENATVTGNKLTQNSAVGSYKPVCVGNALEAQIYDNALVLAAAAPYDYVAVDVGLAQGTYIGINRCAYNGTTTDFDCPVSALGVKGRQDMPSGFILAGTTSQTVVKTTGTGNGTLLIPTPTAPNPDTFALLGAAQVFLSKTFTSSTNTLGGVTMGLGSDATGDLYYRNSGGLLTRLAIGSASNILTVTGGLPAWAAAPAASLVAGTTTIASGTSHGVLTNNASVLGNTAAGTSGQLFLGVTSAEPVFATMGGDATITNAGTLTLASVASAGTTGSSTAIPVVTINAKGLTTGITTAAVVAPAGTLSGATLAAGVTASSLTSVGTLTGGATGAGFTVALGTSTISGTLPCANHPALTGDVMTSASSCATAIGATKVTSAMLNADVFSTAHTWAGQQTFVAPILGTPASGVATNLTGTAASLTAGTATNATNTAITDDVATSSTVFPTWVDTASGNRAQKTSSTGLKYQPSSGTLTATSFQMPPGSAAFYAGQGATAAQITSMVLNGGSSVGGYLNFAAGGTGYAYLGSSGGLVGGTATELLMQAQGGSGLHFQTNATNTDRLVITSAGLVQVPTLGSDAATTDNTVCVGATGTLLKGSGTLGICLGTSSARFKHDIVSMGAGLAEIVRLNPKNFFYDKGYGDDGHRQQYGLIAEEVVKVLPGITSPDKKGKPQSVDLLALVPIMVNAIKQLKADNDNLRMDVLALQGRKKGAK